MACLSARDPYCLDNHSEDTDELAAYVASLLADPILFRGNVQSIKERINALVKENPHVNSKVFRYTSGVESL